MSDARATNLRSMSCWQPGGGPLSKESAGPGGPARTRGAAPRFMQIPDNRRVSGYPLLRLLLTCPANCSILNHMVKHLERHLDATFGALSDATRRGILARLAKGETSVSELAAPYRISLPAVSKHLRVLEDARLIVRRKNGRVHRCRLAARPMQKASEWIAQYRRFWESQFDSLSCYLEKTQNPENLK